MAGKDRFRKVANSPEVKIDEKIWLQAVDEILHHRVFKKKIPGEERTPLTRAMLLEDKKQLYQLMGAIELNKKEFNGIEINTIPSTLFSGRLESKSLVNHGVQLPFEQWDGTTNWGVLIGKEHIKPGLWDIISRFEDSDEIIAAINRRDNAIIIDEKTYLLPEMTLVPEKIIEYTREYFFDFGLDSDDHARWSNFYFNQLPNRSYNHTHEYFSQKKLNFNELPKEYCQLDMHIEGVDRGRQPLLNEFLGAIEEHKESIMKVLKIDNSTYNELAALAVPIFDVESSMGKSFRYSGKERIRVFDFNLGQWGITNLKKAKAFIKNFNKTEEEYSVPDDNSRGPTQIKIKEDFVRIIKDTPYAYLENADLHIHENAGIATIFYLYVKLKILRNHIRQKRHHNIDENNWPNYIYYYWMGRSKQVRLGMATPSRNIKIRKIMNFRKRVYLFESCRGR